MQKIEIINKKIFKNYISKKKHLYEILTRKKKVK